MNILVSIIIPIFNVEKYLSKCLESCINQSYSNIEIIAINDGSTDTSGEIIDEFAAKDNRIKPIHQTNKGVVSARNNAVKQSSGSHLFFVDGDDYLALNAVEKVVTKLLETKCDIVIGSISYDRDGVFSPLTNKITFGQNKIGLACALLTDQLQLSLCSKLIPKSLFNKTNISNELKIGEDAICVIQLLHSTQSISLINDTLYFYVQRSISVMNKPSQRAIESRIKFLSEVSEFYKKHFYFGDESFVNCFSVFMLTQYFAYLRMGGSIEYDIDILKEIKELHLKNKYALAHVPIWRISLIKLFIISPVLGKFFRKIIVFARKLIR